MRVCRLEEGRVYDLREEVGRHCDGVQEAELREAVAFMRNQVEEFASTFRERARELFGFSMRLEAPPPRVIRGKLFSGFWSGVFVYAPRGGAREEPIHIVIEPRVENYDGMLSLIEETLFRFDSFLLLTQAIPLVSPTLLSIDAVRRVLLEAQLLLEKEPKLLSQLVAGESGELLDVHVGSRGAVYRAFHMRRHFNLSLALSLAVAARSVARALAAAEEVLKSLEGGAETRKGLLEAIRRYASRARSYLASLLSDEFIAHSLFSLEAVDVGEIDVERYWHVVHAARTVGRSAQWSEGFLGRSRQFLLPSTKIYELYVYAALVKALEGKCGRGAPKGGLALCIGTSKLFFNHYPGDLSRVIVRLTGAVPSPDIFYLDGRLAAPVECKYRELEGLRLRLGDAERLLSYLADSSRDERLKAVVVSLAAPETRCVRAGINGKEVEVCFAEVDPDKGEAEDQAEQVLSLLTN
ncbi:MAG: hypothetical protein LM563_04885 [Thermofilum sp.]|nr:hypothetical protein [Thermofilum sp.]